MKAVCHTDAAKPSQSLIKGICYPEAFKFTSKATTWGCCHEKEAREVYLRACKSQHTDFCVTECGFFINTQWTYIGASPDGIINCTCHGKGVLEIKCPFCHHETSIQTAATEDSKFCLKLSDGKLHLDQSHAYYYQVQTQLFVCNLDYADFCVCTFVKNPEDIYCDAGIHIECIEKSLGFWTDCIVNAHHFFKTCLLPEIMGNWYTRPALGKANSEGDSNLTNENISENTTESSRGLNNTSNVPEAAYCYCHGPEEGTMIACDNPDCRIEWFHITCLKLKSLPKGKSKWYCPDCIKLP